MKNSLYIGSIAGIRLYIHWTFPIIIIWIMLTNIRQGSTGEQLLWMILFVLSLFACVMLHELGHALAAKRFHIITRDITMLPIGGVARLENMPERPVQELIVALAGPAVNIIIFAILFSIMKIAGYTIDWAALVSITPGNFFPALALLNLWLAVFNLIPAFPMDGGRVFRALLSFRLNRVKATKLAARTGQAIAILFIIAGMLFNPFLVFIGLFIFISAAAESEHVKTHSALSGHVIGELTMKQMPVLDRSDALGKAVDLLLDGQAKNFLVLDGQAPYGTLNREGIIRALTSHGKDAPVESATVKGICYVDAGEPVEDVLQLMQEQKPALLVVKQEGMIAGVVDLDNILEYVMVLNAGAVTVKNKR